MPSLTSVSCLVSARTGDVRQPLESRWRLRRNHRAQRHMWGEALNPLGLSPEHLGGGTSVLTWCLATKWLRRTSSTRCLTSLTSLLGPLACPFDVSCRDSVFGYIAVLLGAFGAYWYIAIQNDVVKVMSSYKSYEGWMDESARSLRRAK